MVSLSGPVGLSGTDLRAVLKGLLRDHVRVTEKALTSSVFLGSADVKPMEV
jgi:uncharacterized protein (DUF1501 family)